MVHVGGTPEPLSVVLEMLRPGDVVTHSFSAGSGLVDESGALLDACIKARQRGILFDVGHGSGSFAERVARVASSVGFCRTRSPRTCTPAASTRRRWTCR